MPARACAAFNNSCRECNTCQHNGKHHPMVQSKKYIWAVEHQGATLYNLRIFAAPFTVNAAIV